MGYVLVNPKCIRGKYKSWHLFRGDIKREYYKKSNKKGRDIKQYYADIIFDFTSSECPINYKYVDDINTSELLFYDDDYVEYYANDDIYYFEDDIIARKKMALLGFDVCGACVSTLYSCDDE